MIMRRDDIHREIVETFMNRRKLLNERMQPNKIINLGGNSLIWTIFSLEKKSGRYQPYNFWWTSQKKI
jgi:hypothetical protein